MLEAASPFDGKTPQGLKQLESSHWLCSQNPAQSPHKKNTDALVAREAEELSANRFACRASLFVARSAPLRVDGPDILGSAR